MAMDIDNLFEVAKKAVLLAGKHVIDNFSRLGNIEDDLERDVKITADREIEGIILKILTKESDHRILSEESDEKEHGSGESRYRWILDPLDGSVNFSRGIPLFCISLSLWEEMKPLVGIVYDFNHNDFYTGLVGAGAWVNNIPIHVGKVKEKKDAILCTGFPVQTDFSDKSLLKFIKEVQDHKKVRLFGSAALSLSYVSSGKTDVYREDNIAIWDVAAGIALVLAAGGEVNIVNGSKKNRYNVIASNKDLIDLELKGRNLK